MRIFLLLCIVLSSCGRNEPEIVSIRGVEMTIPFRILIAGPLSESEQNRVESAIFNTFRHIDQVYNNWNKDSEVSFINNSPGNSEIPISPELRSFLQTCEMFVHLSNGRFDPSIAPAQTLWKKSFKQGEMPSQDDIDFHKEISGWHNFTLKESSIVKKHDSCTLDLGAIAKGYAVDCLASALHKLGHTSLFVEWGGEIKTIGKHPSNRPWSIYIANFEDPSPDAALKVLSIVDRACATSGDYLQYYTLGSRHFSHIINTEKMAPMEIPESQKQSITVIAETCLEADAIATWILSTPNEYRAAVLKDIQQQFPQCEVYTYVNVPEPNNRFTP